MLAVTPEGRVIGSVSGGCVESAVYEAATEVLATGRAQLHTYGISDDDAFAVGLTCGGSLQVLIRAYDSRGEELARMLDAVDRGEPVALATVVGGAAALGAQLTATAGGTRGTLGDPELDRAAADEARGLLAQGTTAVRHIGARGQRRRDEVTLFVQAFRPPARMLVFGAIDYAAATARMGTFLGYRVTVCDARPAFVTPDRFPDADEVVRAWPHEYLARQTDIDERTVVCVLTHDPKFDVPLLLAAVRTRAGYIGVLGSRRTHRERTGRLRAAGATQAELARLASPIGLDLGARTPEETAVSIAAEVISLRWGGTGRRLAALTGDIHRAAAPGLIP
ncbi:XdhC family protein [Streptomyces sp. NPDC057616]|uniref:XdhC family protein n=1 Tax=Streptomyces sp. NPDC057616 TaxID=3346183 RepID=UPI0036BE5BFC